MSKPLLPAEKEVLLWQDKSEKAVLKMLEKHYKDALKDIEEKITAMMGRQDVNLPHVIRRIEYQQMLKEQLQTALERLHSNEYETISEYLKDTYTDAFVGTVYTLHRQDVPVILPVDQSVVVKAVTIDSKLKESLYTSIGKDITELKRSIAAEVTRGIASGMMYSDIARNIRNTASIPMKRAKTIARTEAGRVQEQATFDAAKEAKAVGADVVKQWSSIRDGKTRDSHRKLDGQIREIDEPFEVNGHKGMHPHDFGRPEEDINCRCTMLTRARAALSEEDLKLMQERAAYHGLLVKDSKAFGKAKAKDFSDFRKKYLKTTETLKKQGKSGIIELPEDPFYDGLSQSDIVNRYKKPDGSNLLHESFLGLPIEAQREIVRGYDKAISLFGDIPPQRLKVGKAEDEAYARYDLDFRVISFNPKMVVEKGEGYATAVHEMTHHAENVTKQFDSKKVVNSALKKLGMTSNSKKADNLRIKTVGLDGDWEDPREVVACAVERQVVGRTNPLTEEIYSVLKEKGIIK